MWGASNGGKVGKSKGKGQISAPVATGETYQGVVKSVSQKFGFIACPEIQANYGCDCFCLGEQLAGFNAGDAVEFTVGVSKDGKPQAIEIVATGAPAWGGGGKGGKAMSKGCWGAPGKGGGGAKGGPSATGECYQGVVKSISQKFGFIACPEIQANYGCDCFCLGEQLIGFSVGETVEFTVGLNKSGKPQAIEIGSLGKWGGGFGKGFGGKGFGGKGCWGPCGKGFAGWGPCMGGWDGWGGPSFWGGPPFFGGWGGGAGGGGPTKSKPRPPRVIAMPQPTGEVYTGTIKSISAKFGFIECFEVQAAYGCDCFCLGRQLQMFSVGETVEFEVGINDEGKPQAISVTANGITSVWNDGKGDDVGKSGGGVKRKADSLEDGTE